MKKALLVLAVLAAGASAFAQGTITFFNNNIGSPTYRAGVFRFNGGSPGTVGAGAGYSVGLFLASDLNTPLSTTTGASGVTGFRTTSAQEVFAVAADLVVPGVAPGATANLVVRAWDSAFANYAAAAGGPAGTQYGEQAFTSKALGGVNPAPPPPSFPSPDMAPFTGFTMVPEPSTYALGVLGLGALAMMRRRK